MNIIMNGKNGIHAINLPKRSRSFLTTPLNKSEYWNVKTNNIKLNKDIIPITSNIT